MTTDEIALLRTCLLNSSDQAPLLILADWYEELGQPEKAAIRRMQATLLRLAPVGELPPFDIADILWGPLNSGLGYGDGRGVGCGAGWWSTNGDAAGLSKGVGYGHGEGCGDGFESRMTTIALVAIYDTARLFSAGCGGGGGDGFGNMQPGT